MIKLKGKGRHIKVIWAGGNEFEMMEEGKGVIVKLNTGCFECGFAYTL